jgi:hypothetical protein
VGLLADKRAVTLNVERIAATDRLIDQDVYRTYGLTGEEIKGVEGGCRYGKSLREAR